MKLVKEIRIPSIMPDSLKAHGSETIALPTIVFQHEKIITSELDFAGCSPSAAACAPINGNIAGKFSCGFYKKLALAFSSFMCINPVLRAE